MSARRVAEEIDCGHGRVERRVCSVVADLRMIEKMLPVPLNPTITQLSKVIQGIFHTPASINPNQHAYSNLYASPMVMDSITSQGNRISK
jgi:hypothetical protein